MGIELAEDGFEHHDLGVQPLYRTSRIKSTSDRHCAAHQDDYQDIIHDASRDRAIDYLTSVLGKPWPDVEPFIGEGGKPRLKKPWNIERRVTKIITDYIDDKRDKDGNQTDPRKRWREIDDYVRDPVEREMGPMPEATLDDIDPEVAKKYAIRDADITLRLGPILEQKIRDMDLQKISPITLSCPCSTACRRTESSWLPHRSGTKSNASAKTRWDAPSGRYMRQPV